MRSNYYGAMQDLMRRANEAAERKWKADCRKYCRSKAEHGLRNTAYSLAQLIDARVPIATIRKVGHAQLVA